tara:strand:+ start:1448 stop:1921 length:474 start_codon:yes stop_codon:yes gene_type:complete
MQTELLPYQIILPLIVSMSPFLELRGGIILAIAYGYPPWLAFLACSFFNILAVFLIFLILDGLHEKMMGFNFYKRRIEGYIEKYRHKFSETFTKREIFLYLMSFTAIPFPLTGAYTASLIAWLFNIKRKTSYIAISLGIIISGTVITLASVGIINFF